MNGGSDAALLRAMRDMTDPEQIRLRDLARKIVADNVGLPREVVGRMLIEAGIT